MKKVIIYTLSTCLWCKKTKKYFEDKKIPVEAIDYDKQPGDRQDAMMAEMRSSGGTASFPFVKIGGSCLQGYNPEEFEKLLGK